MLKNMPINMTAYKNAKLYLAWIIDKTVEFVKILRFVPHNTISW